MTGRARRIALLTPVILVLVTGCDEDGAGRRALSTLDADGFPTLSTERDQPMMIGTVRGTTDLEESGWSASALIWSSEAPDVAFGVNVCLEDGSPVHIDAVEPVETRGEGFTPTGTWVFSPAAGESLAISLSGFAPDVLDGSVEEVDAAEFRFECGASGPPQQLLVGLRGTGPDGGGWYGVRIRYSDAAKGRHTLEVPVVGLVCGNSVTPRC